MRQSKCLSEWWRNKTEDSLRNINAIFLSFFRLTISKCLLCMQWKLCFLPENSLVKSRMARRLTIFERKFFWHYVIGFSFFNYWKVSERFRVDAFDAFTALMSAQSVNPVDSKFFFFFRKSRKFGQILWGMLVSASSLNFILISFLFYWIFNQILLILTRTSHFISDPLRYKKYSFKNQHCSYNEEPSHHHSASFRMNYL